MLHSFTARFTAGFLFLLLGGCATFAPQSAALHDNAPAGLPSKVELTEVPFYPQQDYYCGPATLAMVLNALGVNITVDALAEQVYLPGRKGSLQVEMLAATRRQGLVAYRIEPQLDQLLAEVAAGNPVIVLENYGFSWYPVWHYSVVIGYDLKNFEVVRRSGLKERQVQPLPVFEHLWKKENYWAMVAVPPERAPASATESGYAAAIVALESSGHTAPAHRAYATLLERWPDNLIARIGHGNTAYALGDVRQAEAEFRRAGKDHPDSAAAFNNLAQTLADQGLYDQALEAADKAIALGGPLLSTAQATLDEIRKKLAAKQ